MLQRKLQFSLLAAVLLAAVVYVPHVSAAQSDGAAAAKTAAAQKAAKLAERIANYKTKQAVKLATAEETKLKGSCKAAQAKITALGAKSTATYTARTKLFTSVTTKLTSLQTGLTDAGVETKDLEAAQAAFLKAGAEYKTAYEALQSDLTDTAELDCVTDPTAFKAALMTARTDRQVMADKAKAVVDILPTVRAALVTARKDLAKDTTTGTDTTETTSTGGAQ